MVDVRWIMDLVVVVSDGGCHVVVVAGGGCQVDNGPGGGGCQ